MLNYTRGDIVLIDFPPPYGPHPALIVSNRGVFTSEKKFICAMITSSLHDDAFSYLIKDKMLTQGPMPKESEVRCHLIFLIDQDKIGRKMNLMKAGNVDEVATIIYRNVLK